MGLISLPPPTQQRLQLRCAANGSIIAIKSTAWRTSISVRVMAALFATSPKAELLFRPLLLCRSISKCSFDSCWCAREFAWSRRDALVGQIPADRQGWNLLDFSSALAAG